MLGTAEHAGWQSDDGPQQLEHSAHSDADDSERQQQQPDKWVKYQGRNGQRPAQNQQNAPKEKTHHLISLRLSIADCRLKQPGASRHFIAGGRFGNSIDHLVLR